MKESLSYDERCSFRFYDSLDSIEKSVMEVHRRGMVSSKDARWFLCELERQADDVLRVAANAGWAKAYLRTDFLDFFRRLEDFLDDSSSIG